MDYTLDAEPGHYTYTGHSPTIITSGPENGSGDTVTTVNAPQARSQARISSAGTVSIEIAGPPGLGTRGEHRVAKVIRACLQREGVAVSVRSGVDADGVDRWIDTPGGSYPLQVTSVPRDPGLWQQASRGSGTTVVGMPGAVEWIEDSIQHKVTRTTSADRACMILALDALHAGPLAEGAVVASYLSRYGSPITRFGFGSVWLVGATVDQCVRLGDGRPLTAATGD
jgi:hypothetical protein